MTADMLQLRTIGALHEDRVRVVVASSKAEVLRAFDQARSAGHELAVLGGRRSFGGQAFPIQGGIALDVGELDRGAQLLETEPDGSVWVRAGGGTRFLDLHHQLPGYRVHAPPTTDSITLAGSLASCVHNMAGYFADAVRAFTLLTPSGESIVCRDGAEGLSGELFEANIGAQGALGVVTDIELRLHPIAPDQQVVIHSCYAGPARDREYLDVLETTTDDPRFGEGAGAVVYRNEGHAIVLGEELLAPGRQGPGSRAPLTDDAHDRNAFTQGLANRFPRLAEHVIRRTYRQGASCWSDWYGFSFFQRSFDRTPEVLGRRGPVYALARAIGVDPRLPVRHQTWFFPRAELRAVMQIYWAALRRFPGIERRAEQQDLVLLPACRWPMHSIGRTHAGVGVLTSSYAIRPGTELAERVTHFYTDFTREAFEAVPGFCVSLCKQIHCETSVLHAMHEPWITQLRAWRQRTDPDEIIASRLLAKLGLSRR